MTRGIHPKLPGNGETLMTDNVIRKLTAFFSALALVLIAMTAMANSPAHAGKKKLHFGGPIGNFNATRHGSGSYNNNGYNNKAKARARAKAKAKARARAKAKARAAAAQKRKAAKARAAARNSNSGPTESNTAAAPSTAALLTKKDIGTDANKTKKNPSGDENVAVAKTGPDDDSSATDTDTTSTSRIRDQGSGECKRFVPEIGTTISVEC